MLEIPNVSVSLRVKSKAGTMYLLSVLQLLVCRGLVGERPIHKSAEHIMIITFCGLKSSTSPSTRSHCTTVLLMYCRNIE
jgi:hypothetical protein